MLHLFRRLVISNSGARSPGLFNPNSSLGILAAQQRFFSGAEFLKAAKEGDDEQIEENISKKFPSTTDVNNAFFEAAKRGHYLVLNPIVESHKDDITNITYNKSFVAAARAHQLPTAIFVFEQAPPHAITLDSINKVVTFIESMLKNPFFSKEHLKYAEKALETLIRKREELNLSSPFTPAFAREKQEQVITFSSSVTPEAEPEQPKPAKKVRKT